MPDTYADKSLLLEQHRLYGSDNNVTVGAVLSENGRPVRHLEESEVCHSGDLLIGYYAAYSDNKASYGSAFGEDTPFSPELSEAYESLDGAVNDFYLILSENGLNELIDPMAKGEYSGLMDLIEAKLTGQLGSALSFTLLVLSMTAIICISGLFMTDNPSVSASSTALGVLSVSIFSASLYPVLNSALNGLTSVCGLFSKLMPVFSAVMLAGGNLNAAATESAGLSLTLSFITYLASGMLMPVSVGIMVASLADALGGDGVAGRFLTSVYGWMIGIFGTLLSGVIALRSLVSSAADSMYLRTAKYAASTLIPVVGSTVSGALSSLVGGALYAGSALGVGTVIAVVYLLTAPLFSLLLRRVVLGLSFTLLRSFSSKCTAVVGAMKGAMDFFIGAYTLSTVLFLFEAIAFLKCGVELYG